MNQDSRQGSGLDKRAISGRNEHRSSSGLKRFLYYALLAAGTPVIPIPLFDDWVLSKIKRHMVKDLYQRRSVEVPTGRALEILSDTVPNWRATGCFLGVIKSTFLLVAKLVWRFFRKILFFLTLKDAVDLASKTLHEALMIQAILESPSPSMKGRLHEEKVVERLRWAMDKTLDEFDTRPLEKLFRAIPREGRNAIRQAIKRISQKGREIDLSVDEEEDNLSPLVDDLAREIEQRRGYFSEMEECLRGKIHEIS